jgi:acetyl-CoA carboxylase biotin carboxylase subunit
MLSKLIAYAPTRELAIARMLRALDEYVIGGIRSNLTLFKGILSDPAFQAANIDTGYLDRFLSGGFISPSLTPDTLTLDSLAPEPPDSPAGENGAIPNVAVPEATISDAQISAAAIFEQISEKRSTQPTAPATDRQWKTAAIREALRP